MTKIPALALVVSLCAFVACTGESEEPSAPVTVVTDTDSTAEQRKAGGDPFASADAGGTTSIIAVLVRKAGDKPLEY